MRTTLSIDETVLNRAKEQARAAHQVLGEFVEEALRDKLSRPAASIEPPPLPVFTRGTGPVAGVDLTTNPGLFEALGSE